MYMPQNNLPWNTALQNYGVQKQGSIFQPTMSAPAPIPNQQPNQVQNLMSMLMSAQKQRDEVMAREGNSTPAAPAFNNVLDGQMSPAPMQSFRSPGAASMSMAAKGLPNPGFLDRMGLPGLANWIGK